MQADAQASAFGRYTCVPEWNCRCADALGGAAGGGGETCGCVAWGSGEGCLPCLSVRHCLHRVLPSGALAAGSLVCSSRQLAADRKPSHNTVQHCPEPCPTLWTGTIHRDESTPIWWMTGSTGVGRNSVEAEWGTTGGGHPEFNCSRYGDEVDCQAARHHGCASQCRRCQHSACWHS